LTASAKTVSRESCVVLRLTSARQIHVKMAARVKTNSAVMIASVRLDTQVWYLFLSEQNTTENPTSGGRQREKKHK